MRQWLSCIVVAGVVPCAAALADGEPEPIRIILRADPEPDDPNEVFADDDGPDRPSAADSGRLSKGQRAELRSLIRAYQDTVKAAKQEAAKKRRKERADDRGDKRLDRRNFTKLANRKGGERASVAEWRKVRSWDGGTAEAGMPLRLTDGREYRLVFVAGVGRNPEVTISAVPDRPGNPPVKRFHRRFPTVGPRTLAGSPYTYDLKIPAGRYVVDVDYKKRAEGDETPDAVWFAAIEGRRK